MRIRQKLEEKIKVPGQWEKAELQLSTPLQALDTQISVLESVNIVWTVHIKARVKELSAFIGHQLGKDLTRSDVRAAIIIISLLSYIARLSLGNVCSSW